jgi:hypothetical protein
MATGIKPPLVAIINAQWKLDYPPISFYLVYLPSPFEFLIRKIATSFTVLLPLKSDLI